MSTNEHGQVATNEFSSYESFLSSVFTSMGVPYSKPVDASTRQAHINTKTASTKDSLTPLSSNEEESSNSIHSKSSPPLLEEPPMEARVKRQRVEESKSQYRRVSSNKLVRVSDKVQPRKPTPPNGYRSGTMYFGTSNDPKELCQNYCQTGTCPWKGRCRFVHDPSKVIVCPNWMKQKCEKRNCTLQHVHRKELMSHCTLFQIGQCMDSTCPLLHAIYDPNLSPCINFQRSYCPNGVHCPRRHLFGANYGASS